MQIQLKPIKSSQIASVGYDESTKTLAVMFNSGKKVYHYADVPKDIFDGFHGNGSAGKHFAAKVRGKFTHSMHDYKEDHHGKAEKAKGL